MNFDEFCRIVNNRFPEWAIEVDNEGQIIIYTGLRVEEDSDVLELV